MQFERFNKIVNYNKAHMNKITDYIRDFYSELGLEKNENILRIDQLARNEFEKRKYVMIELPLKDKEIGAMAYRGDHWGYVFINSSLPKVNVNFALCHEFYHILFRPDTIRNTIELYENEKYHEDENEKTASLLAGAILMPEYSFRTMFSKFQSSLSDEIDIVCNLMNYFEAPYMATVIRSYELGLFDDYSERIKRLLNVDAGTIKTSFEKNWLDSSILSATCNDQFKKVLAVVEQLGEKEVESGRLKESSLNKIKNNLENIYTGLVR